MNGDNDLNHSLNGTLDGRMYYIDVMKTIGMVCLFIAHVDPPFLIKEMRGYDVLLMVYISTFLAGYSLKRKESYFNYVYKRILRLVIPTWTFLILFYACMCATGNRPSISDVIKSFLFQRDCGLAGGVWIILVYIYCSLVTPLLVKLHNWKTVLILGSVMLLVNEWLCNFSVLVNNRAVYYTVLTLLPYCSYVCICVACNNMPKKWKIITTMLIGVVHVFLAVILWSREGLYVSIDVYKYPARFYYISYALPICVLLHCILKASEVRLPRLSIVCFISEHSLWIYLWQILLLCVVNYVLYLPDSWILRLFVILIGSTSITFFQTKFVTAILGKRYSGIARYFLC